MRPAFILALGFCLVSLGSAFAGLKDRVVLSFGTGVGYSIAMGEVDANGNTLTVRYGDWGIGRHFNGSLGYILDKHQKYTLSATVDYTNYIRNIKEVDIQRDNRSLDVLSVFADFKVRLRPENAIVNPYFKGGLGLFSVKIVDGQRAVSVTQKNIGLGFDTGVDFALTNRVGVFVDAQYQIGLTSGKISQNIPIKAGLFIR